MQNRLTKRTLSNAASLPAPNHMQNFVTTAETSPHSGGWK